MTDTSTAELRNCCSISSEKTSPPVSRLSRQTLVRRRHMDVDKVLQLLVKDIDPAAPRIAKGLVVDVAVADEDVVLGRRHVDNLHRAIARSGGDLRGNGGTAK